MIALNDAHMLSPDAEKCRSTLGALLKYQTTILTPDMNVREAARIFETAESEALAVVDGDGLVSGLLTEAHLLRRYTEELDKIRKDLSGET